MKKERQSNYELMRIISMFFIVIYHIIYHGKLLDNTNGTIHLMLLLILCISLVHVNSFILVSGYFQYNKKFSIKSFFQTLNSAWFYKIVIATILLVTGIYGLTKMQYINAFNPIYLAGYWFVACYLILYILSPFLNILIQHMNQKIHRRLIIISILCFTIFPFISEHYLGPNDGFTVIQFIILYFIGAYFAKYPIQNNIHFKNYSKNKLQLLLFIGFFGFAFINFIFYCFGTTLESFQTTIGTYIGNQITFNALHYNCLFVLAQSICYFLWFGTLNIKSKIINFISPLVFGVYLIHDNPYIQVMLYKWLKIDTGILVTSPIIFVKIFVIAISIFIICAFIEFIRQKIFNFIKRRKTYKKITNKFYNYIQNY